jgi:hypothetical protein
MTQRKERLIDTAFIVGGIGMSTLFISIDGNGQNPLPVAGAMLFVAFITFLVSFLVARFVHSVPLSIATSAVVTDVLFVIYFVCLFAFSQRVPEHGSEELVLFPIVFVVATAPAVIFSSIGFGRIASSIFSKNHIEEKGIARRSEISTVKVSNRP